MITTDEMDALRIKPIWTVENRIQVLAYIEQLLSANEWQASLLMETIDQVHKLNRRLVWYRSLTMTRIK